MGEADQFASSAILIFEAFVEFHARRQPLPRQVGTFRVHAGKMPVVTVQPEKRVDEKLCGIGVIGIHVVQNVRFRRH